MDKATLEDFLDSFDDNQYPDDFLQSYEPIECLASNPTGETLLVRNRQTGEYFTAKCYRDPSLLSHVTESELLKGLHHPGLPAFVAEYQNDAMLCVVREYAEGTPLSKRNKPFTEREAIDICLSLCDILTYLHSRTPPIIHRDIKPQNIIMDESGAIKLIDFGISRLYDATAQTDTVFFGTQEFAPPEQYGFSQTDGRADIFSLGILLCWLLTGKTRTETAREAVGNKRLAHIIRKCTAFAPKDRYRGAYDVRRALTNADGHRQKKALRICAAALALFAVLTAGFALGRFTDICPPVFYDLRTAAFAEPLIEKAVRLQLGKTDGEPILREELTHVTELYLCDDRTVKTWEEFNTLRDAINRGTIVPGDGAIATLEDVAKLPNLQNLCLGNQDFTDISPVADLTGLTVLEFFNCPIGDISAIGGLNELTHLNISNCDPVRDISPLADSPNIRELVLCSCRAEDFSPLASVGDLEYLHMQDVDPDRFLPHIRGKHIRQLRMGYRPLSSLAELAGIEGLQELFMEGMQVPTLAGIAESLPELADVRLTGMPGLDLIPLTELPYLKTLTVSTDMRKDAEAIAGEADFQINYQD